MSYESEVEEDVELEAEALGKKNKSKDGKLHNI